MQVDWPQEQCDHDLQAMCILYDHLIFTNTVHSPYQSCTIQFLMKDKVDSTEPKFVTVLNALHVFSKYTDQV